MGPLFAILNTHTTRHLRRTLLGVAASSVRPTRVVVSCDRDEEGLAEVCGEAASAFGLDITWVGRASSGEIRLGQLRNNGVRALLEDGVAAEGLLVFLDGDSAPDHHCFARYLALSEKADLLIGGRVMMTEEQTERFDEQAMQEGRPPCTVQPDQTQALLVRQRRYLWQQRLKPFGLTKPHKPKPVGGNHAVTFRAFVAINGADEEFLGGFQEDDDLGRRLHQAKFKAAVAVTEAIVYHQWHPTRHPGSWAALPNSDRLAGAAEVRCRFGLATPFAQAAIKRRRFPAMAEAGRG